MKKVKGRLLLILLLGTGLASMAQEFGARVEEVQRGGRPSFEPRGPGVLFDALDPVVYRWYVPGELYTEFGYTRTYSNYARALNNYQRYVSTALEGNYFYDALGNLQTRGWLIFDWRQEQPAQFGSLLVKDMWFNTWFSNLLVAADHRGQHYYAVTLGNQIRATLTPLTFSKPLFNGVVMDFANDNLRWTLLLSRISQPNTLGGQFLSSFTNNTNLMGNRLAVQIGDFARLGGTFVNAHHERTDFFDSRWFRGDLTEIQDLDPVSSVTIRILDDSPEDGRAGGALFAADLILHTRAGKEVRASEIGFRPLIEGGFQRRGYLAADGQERVQLFYNLLAEGYTGPEPATIRRIEVELVVANDYRIEISSGGPEDPFFEVARAAGNVDDGSNQRVLRFDYGLPTANQIAGFTLELTDLERFDGYLEVDLNHQFRQFPNPDLDRHHITGEKALAWMAFLQGRAYPCFATLEAFSISPRYTTSFAVADIKEGAVSYDRPFQRYEFVDDNDDLDRYPDWTRSGWTSGDREVFPGWDENNDFVSDFNQNDSPTAPNRIPDYEEPFLRFHTDRPEFLYGVDMNHNGWIDRFENDEEADLPYRRDQQGFNLYGGVHLGPALRVVVGYQRIGQRAEEGRNRDLYGLVTADRAWSNWGRVRLFQDLRKVRDSIRDDLVQWMQPADSRGELQPVPDPLPAPDTYIATTWLGADFERIPGVKVRHLLKWQLYHQRDGEQALALRGQRQDGSFLGLIDKVEYRLELGKLTLIPAAKSEFRRQAPVQASQVRRREWSLLAMGYGRMPILSSSYLEGGLEYYWFGQLRQPTPPGAMDRFREVTAVAQLTNVTEYQGYLLTMILGFEMARKKVVAQEARQRTRGFLIVYASVR